MTSRLLRRVTQPGGNGLIDKDGGRGGVGMQVVTRDDGGIAGMPGGQTAGLQDDRRSDGQGFRGIAQQQHLVRSNLPQRVSCEIEVAMPVGDGRLPAGKMTAAVAAIGVAVDDGGIADIV